MFGYSAVFFPRPTRFVASLFSVVAIAHTLHDLFSMLKGYSARASQDG